MQFLEIILYAFVIFSESLHEPVYDKIAVASVIHNRATVKDYLTVLTKPKQFSCLNNYKIIFNNITKIPERQSEFALCLKIAGALYFGRSDPTTTATHYTRKEVSCSWMTGMKVVLETKHHKFMEAE